MIFTKNQIETKMSLLDRIFSVVLVFLWWTILFFELQGMHIWYMTLLWMAFGLLYFICKKRIEIHVNTPYLILFSFFIFIFGSTLINHLYRMENLYFEKIVLLSVCIFLIPSCVVFFATDNKFLHGFFRIFRGLIIASCFGGIYDFVTRNFWYEFIIQHPTAVDNFHNYCHPDGLSAYRLTLIFYHPIFYSVILFVFIVYAVYFPVKNIFLGCLEMMVLLSNLILTHSRTGIAITGMFFVFYFVRHRKHLKDYKRQAVILGVLSIILLTILLVTYPSLAYELFQKIFRRIISTRNGFWGNVRMNNWKLVRDMWKEGNILQVFFGGGYLSGFTYLQSHPLALSSEKSWSGAIDNQYLTFLMDYGIVGTLLFFSYILAICRSLYHAVIREEEFLCCTVLGICISGLTYEFIGYNHVFFMFLILSGMLIDSKEDHQICLLNLGKEKA